MNLKKVLMHMYKCTFMFLEFGIWSCTLQTPTLNLSVCLQHRTWDVIEYNSLVLYYGWLVLLCLHLKHRNLLFLVMFMKASNRIDSNTNMNNTKAMQCKSIALAVGATSSSFHTQTHRVWISWWSSYEGENDGWYPTEFLSKQLYWWPNKK